VLVDAAGTHATHQDTIDEAFQWLTRNLAPGDVVLFKASRGMRFEDLIGKIKGWGGPQ
jgi:UDP-N-acetylmuramyl pentapeptide synthase